MADEKDDWVVPPEGDAIVPPPANPVTPSKEVVKSFGRGAAIGAMDIAGMPGDAQEHVIDPLSDWLVEQLGLPELSDEQKAQRSKMSLPGSAKIRKGVESVTGPLGEPKTRPEKVAQAVGQALPTGFIGGGAAAPRFVGAGLSGLTGELAGQAAEGSVFEIPAKIGGAMLGGGVGAAATSPARARSSFDTTFEAFERLGLRPTAATTGVGGKTSQWLESNVLPQALGSANRMEKVVSGNTEQFVKRKDEIARQFGAPRNRVDTGEELQEVVRRGWEGQKEEAGKIFNAIESAFGPNDFFVPKHLDATLAKPLVNASSPSIKSITQTGELKAMETALAENGGLLSYADMKALKTTYGDLIAPNMAKNPNEAQISKIVKALDDDMEGAVKSLANPDVLHDWHYAKATYNNAMTDYRQAFKKLLGTSDMPVRGERVYDIMMGQAGNKATADIESFEKVWRTLGKQKQGDLSATVLTQMGNTDPAKFGSVDGFSFSTFLTNYKNLSPQAKDMLFKQTGNTATLEAMDDLMLAADKMGVWGKLASTSKSGMGGMALGQTLGAATSAAYMASTGHWLAGLTALTLDLAGPYAASMVLTNPKAVKAMANALNKANDGAIGAVRGVMALEPVTSVARRRQPAEVDDFVAAPEGATLQ